MVNANGSTEPTCFSWQVEFAREGVQVERFSGTDGKAMKPEELKKVATCPDTWGDHTVLAVVIHSSPLSKKRGFKQLLVGGWCLKICCNSMLEVTCFETHLTCSKLFQPLVPRIFQSVGSIGHLRGWNSSQKSFYWVSARWCGTSGQLVGKWWEKKA